MSDSTPNSMIGVPLGDTTVTAQAPPGWRVSVAEHPANSQTVPPALEFGQRLKELAQGAQNAVIAFTDTTRACPDSVLIPPMLEKLRQAGVPQEGITLLCAVGMHRPITEEEKDTKLGAEIAARYRVVSHNPADVVSLGEVDGVPLLVNRLCVEADLLLATGIVEPHQYAGWSGGGKTVAIGCGGAETIAATHSPRFIDDPSVRVAQLEGSGFQRVVQESARRVGLKYVVNVGLDEEKHIIARGSGTPEKVQAALVRHLLSLCEVKVDAPFDVVIAGVGHPKDVNLYQASRAATYIGLSQHQLLRPGGVIILPATCPEGAGHGVGEQNFLDGMANASDIDGLLNRLRREGCRPGEQRAFILGKVLREHPVIVVGAQDPDIVQACHMTPAADMDEAFRLASEYPAVGETPDALVVPHATQTLPVPRG
jgi:nickel-dependent lactate racemase